MFSCTHTFQNCSKLFCGSCSWICRLCIYSQYTDDDEIGNTLAFDSFYTPLHSSANLNEVDSNVF